jgi:serine/threonine protein kinase
MPAPRLKDRYQIEAQLGQSELATTYLARDLTRHRRVVVKELALGRVEAEKTVELFEREAKVLARLKHPRIARFIEFFSLDSTDDVRLYLVQEQVAGKTSPSWSKRVSTSPRAKSSSWESSSPASWSTCTRSPRR